MKRQSPDCLREHTGAILNHSERRLQPKKCTNIWKQMCRCAQPKPLSPSATHTPPATVKTGLPNQVLCMQVRLEMGRDEGEERVWEARLLNNLYLFNTGKAAWSRGLNSCVCRMCVCFWWGFCKGNHMALFDWGIALETVWWKMLKPWNKQTADPDMQLMSTSMCTFPTVCCTFDSDSASTIQNKTHCPDFHSHLTLTFTDI